MKKLIVTLLVALLGLPVWSQQSRMSALFSYSTFYLPTEEQPYVETYLLFDAGGLVFSETEVGRYRATVEVTMVYKSGDEIIYAKKYDLNSPTTASRDDNRFSFLDLQRVGLIGGERNEQSVGAGAGNGKSAVRAAQCAHCCVEPLDGSGSDRYCIPVFADFQYLAPQFLGIARNCRKKQE